MSLLTKINNSIELIDKTFSIIKERLVYGQKSTLASKTAKVLLLHHYLIFILSHLGYLYWNRA